MNSKITIIVICFLTWTVSSFGMIDSKSGLNPIEPLPTEPPFCSGNNLFSHNPDPNPAIFDNDCPLFTSDAIEVNGLTGNISKVTVRLTIYHTYVEDIDVYLQHPSGLQVELSTDNGDWGDMHYIDTIFDDNAAVSIIDGIAPFTGTYRPEGNLSDFIGLEGNGEWQLLMCDGNEDDVGYFDEWDLCLETESSPPESVPTMNTVSFMVLITVLSILMIYKRACSSIE